MIGWCAGLAVRERQLHQESPWRGGCGQARPYDIRVMEDTETDLEALLEDWRGGRADGADLYPALRQAMYQAARQGIGVITSWDPDPQDVEDAVYDAFRELEQQDPVNVVSVVGLARKIAYRRGQDAGRKIVRRREHIRDTLADRAVTAEVQFRDEDVRAAADQEVLAGDALGCLEALTDEQRDVVRATLMGRESLSDWALRTGKTHQAARRQRGRALESLRRCIEVKRSGRRRAQGGNDE
jgi:DNA-directed RNA polymerase specialized sigma24 family protein